MSHGLSSRSSPKANAQLSELGRRGRPAGANSFDVASGTTDEGKTRPQTTDGNSIMRVFTRFIRAFGIGRVSD